MIAAVLTMAGAGDFRQFKATTLGSRFRGNDEQKLSGPEDPYRTLASVSRG